jgi:hypothetical protein
MTVTHPLIRFLLDSGDVEFSGTQVISARLVEQTSVVSTDTPINTLEFKVKTVDDTFSMFSDSFSLLKEKLPILAYEYVDGSARLLGKFYLEKWKNTSERVIEFSAYDILGVLKDTDFDGAFLATPTTLTDVMSQTFVPINVSYEIESSLASVEISGYNPAGSYRDALQQICFAAGATIITSRREEMLITPIVIPSLVYDTIINDSARMQNPTVELLPVVSRIELVSHNYAQGADIETIYDETLDAGSYKIVFGKPYYNVVITGPGYTQSTLGTEGGDEIGTEGGDTLEAGGEYVTGSNAVYLTLTTGGQVTITGYPWLDSKRSFIFNETGTSEVVNKKTLTISNAMMINVDNAQSILDTARDYNRLRYTQKMRLLPTVEVNTGDIVLSSALQNKKLIAAALKIESDLTRGFLADIELRGTVRAFIPPAENPVRYARSGVAVSGAGLTRNNSWRQYA